MTDEEGEESEAGDIVRGGKEGFSDALALAVIGTACPPTGTARPLISL